MVNDIGWRRFGSWLLDRPVRLPSPWFVMVHATDQADESVGLRAGVMPLRQLISPERAVAALAAVTGLIAVRAGAEWRSLERSARVGVQDLPDHA